MRLVATCLGAWVVVALPASAQQAWALTSTIETGWTSNASERPSGASDIYIRNVHALRGEVPAGDVVLRGSLSLDQTQFQLTRYEDDVSLAADIEAEWLFDPSLVLRLGYSASRSWTGDELDLGGVALAVRTDETVQSAGLELTAGTADRRLVLDAAATWHRSAPAQIELIGPLTLVADVTSAEAGIAWESALSPHAAVLAEMRSWFTTVTVAEQLAFSRFPANQGRVVTGLRWQDGPLGIEVRAGFDLVVPKIDGLDTRLLSSNAVALNFQATEKFRLTFAAANGVELTDPLDGVAGRTTEWQLGAVYAVTEATELQVGVSSDSEAGLYDGTVSSRSLSLSAGLQHAFSKVAAVTAKAVLSGEVGSMPALSTVSTALQITTSL